MPGCSNQIKESVNINDVQFGTLGSVVYGGIVVGSVVAYFTLLDQFIIMAFLRFMIGFFQVFICIYMPVWADTFANSEQQKAAWITFLIMASPLGIFLGFTLTSVMVSWKTWEWSFYIQGIGLIPCIVGFIFVPSKYFEVENAQKQKN